MQMKAGMVCTYLMVAMGCGGTEGTGVVPDAGSTSDMASEPSADMQGPVPATDTMTPSLDGPPVSTADAMEARPECDQKVPACKPFSMVNTAATERDRRSMRATAGYNCERNENGVVASRTYVSERTCEYSETCVLVSTPAASAACVSCGIKGNRQVKETVDGVVNQDCAGCTCGNPVFRCYPAGAPETGLAQAAVVINGIRGVGTILASGTAAPQPAPAVTTVRKVHKLDIRPGGEIDVEFTVDTSEAGKVWHADARVAGACP